VAFEIGLNVEVTKKPPLLGRREGLGIWDV